MGLHHKLCHTLGGRFGLPHAELHTVLLPHTAAYNQAAAPDALERAARALGAESAPLAIAALAAAIGAPRSLQAIGMPADGLDEAAALAVAAPYPNPAPISRDGIRVLLGRAFRGDPPA
jgi:maleylacetate reductase